MNLEREDERKVKEEAQERERKMKNRVNEEGGGGGGEERRGMKQRSERTQREGKGRR